MVCAATVNPHAQPDDGDRRPGEGGRRTPKPICLGVLSGHAAGEVTGGMAVTSPGLAESGTPVARDACVMPCPLYVPSVLHSALVVGWDQTSDTLLCRVDTAGKGPFPGHTVDPRACVPTTVRSLACTSAVNCRDLVAVCVEHQYTVVL